MKYPALLSLLILFACGCDRNEVRTKLLNEQKILKDSANNINERIGADMQKGVYDSAGVKKKQLEAVHARLINIQSSIDSLEKVK
jgi:hypothetical protein